MIRPLLAAALAAISTPVLAAGGAGAPAQPGSQLQLAMTVYAGGITMGKVDMDATIRGSDYHVVSNLHTQGVVNTFWQSEIQATSSGKLGSKNFTPALYDSFATNHTGKKQQISLTYDGANAPRLYADPVYSTTGYDVKNEEARGTLDPLSALTMIASGVAAQPGNPCTFTAPIFDGRRRYNIEMTKVRDVDIKMDNGLYQGKAVQCDIRYRQIAGFKPRLLKNSDAFPVIHAWIASFPSDIAGRDYTVPLRVWAETRYGVVAVLATTLKVDGQSPKGVRQGP